MSSRRISLTVPDEVYEALQSCKENNGWSTYAGTALSLIMWLLSDLGYLSKPYNDDDDYV